jgi:hypothetical protein
MSWDPAYHERYWNLYGFVWITANSRKIKHLVTILAISGLPTLSRTLHIRFLAKVGQRNDQDFV